jgi:hypothetical protein
MATLLETVMRKYTIPCRLWLNDDVKTWKFPYSFSFYIDIITATPKTGKEKAFYNCQYLASNSSIKIRALSKDCNSAFRNNRLRIDTKGNILYLPYDINIFVPLIDLKDIPRFFKKLLTQSCFKTPISNMNEFIIAIHKCKAEIIHDILSPQELTKVGQYIRKSHE